MIQKEVNELRRRMAPEKNAIERIYGCYVNSAKQIVSEFEESLALLPEFETEKYLALFRGTLGGGLGRNLLTLDFSVNQVADSDEHRLLTTLRNTPSDGEAREQLYRKIIDSYPPEDMGYLILLATDAYDVPKKHRDDVLDADGSETVFRYLLCALCPVKDGKPELGYQPEGKNFRGCITSQTVCAPVLGFLFPAFDSRAANIYSALYFTKNPGEIHTEVIDAVFHTEIPMSAAEQRDTFEGVLAETLEKDCRFDVVQTVHEQVRDRIAQYKESKDPQPMEFTALDMVDILSGTGVPEEKVQAFRSKCNEEFGVGTNLIPTNLVDTKKFELVTPEVKITVNPQFSYLIETKVIGGRRYVLIPADEGVEINGMNVTIDGEEAEEE